ncbi:hypothetical protein OEV98_14240 [Caldibacillus lycopersici]|uniref:Spore coat protein n=1 Tax=Perspicuibacillus lycopersici TaxID=1325689 RepID=A0AAE3IXF9_9BACI|nr:hypothetical protein [Perspicuibacillus lycopersici]MCU9614699.1 hypothetical protein [Perspicuibacillus lycopersici]
MAERKGVTLPKSQQDLVNILVKNTLKKHNIQPNKNLTKQEKEEIRNLFSQLQNEVNELLQEEKNNNTTNTNAKLSKKGK